MESFAKLHEWIMMDGDNQRYSLDLIAQRNISEVRNFYEQMEVHFDEQGVTKDMITSLIAQIDFAIKSNSAMFVRSNVRSNRYVNEVNLTGNGEGGLLRIVLEIDKSDNSVLHLLFEKETNNDTREVFA